MAVIVGVHGIAQQFKGGYKPGSAWFDALHDGLAAAEYRADRMVDNGDHSPAVDRYLNAREMDGALGHVLG
jgi:hypothetical protein